MVDDTIETTSSNNCLNFQFSSTNQNLQSFPNSLNKCNDINATKQLDLLTVTNQTSFIIKYDLLSVSADNLSWKFFDQVDSLDHRLRKDESTSSLMNDDRFLLSSGCLDEYDVNADANVNDFEGMQSKQFQIDSHGRNYTQNDKRVTSKTNGYAFNGTPEDLSNEILPQTAVTTTATAATIIKRDDLNIVTQPQQQSFVFTTPTSTFKRKKQQQLLKEEQKLHKSCTTTTTTTTQTITTTLTNDSTIDAKERTNDYSFNSSSGNNDTLRHNNKSKKRLEYEHKKSQVDPAVHEQALQSSNETKTMINSSTGVIITDTVAHASPSLIGSGSVTTGCSNSNNNGTTRSCKTRTLPSGITPPVVSAVTSTKRNYNNLADGVDLVDDTKPDFLTKVNKKNNNNSSYKERRLRRHKKMGASSSGGDGDCTTTVKGLSNSSIVDDIEMHFGLTGWRKKCLYILLLLLMLLIITNLVLTLWILKVMEFSTEGMGQLKIVPGGIQLNGQTLIMDMLRASTIRSRHGQPISIESSRNFSINTRDMNGMLENHLFLGHDKLECLTKGFRINDTAGRNLFSVNRNEVTIGAHALRIDGEGGAIFRESIQTPHLRAEPGRELRLESPTRELEITAAKDINLQSRAGGIELTALEDVKLSTIDGSLHFESSKIFMPNLRTAQLPLTGTAQNHEHLHRVFQLCACSNGKLFLAAPHSICAGDDSSVCR